MKTELFTKCMERRCNTPASGVFRVTYKSGHQKLRLLCADCAFNKVVNHVRMFIPPGKAEPVFYHDVYSVDLIKSLTTDFVPPPPKKELKPLVVPVVVQRSTRPLKPLRLQFVTDKDFDPNPEWVR